MIVLSSILLVSQVNAEETSPIKSQNDKLSYGLGVDMARNIKKQNLEVDTELIIKGIKDGLAGGKLLISDKELRGVMNDLKNEMRKKMVLSRRAGAVDNKAKGEKYLKENKVKDGVVTLTSGVQYKILKAGTGKRPIDTDTVECYYRGTLIDGTEFEATEEGKPATLKVAQVIVGWKEALLLMPVGSKWQIIIPSQLAYGERGAGNGDIGANETLIFEVELLAVK
jgi:FKBP-type peptidyl-prolyl cis-trans isomerase FklB